MKKIIGICCLALTVAGLNGMDDHEPLGNAEKVTVTNCATPVYIITYEHDKRDSPLPYSCDNDCCKNLFQWKTISAKAVRDWNGNKLETPEMLFYNVADLSEISCTVVNALRDYNLVGLKTLKKDSRFLRGVIARNPALNSLEMTVGTLSPIEEIGGEVLAWLDVVPLSPEKNTSTTNDSCSLRCN